MVGLLVATLTFTVLVAALLAVLVVVTVLPVFVTLQMADVRRFSTGRWLLLSVVTVLAGLGCAYLLHKHTHAGVAAAAPLLLVWAGPGVLWLLDEGQTRYGGRAGLHE